MELKKEEAISLLKNKILEVKRWMLEDGTKHDSGYVNVEHHDGEIKITNINQISQLGRSLVARHIYIDNRRMGKDIKDFIEECASLGLPLVYGGHRKGYVLY